jgi:type I restriction enzyme M protein
MARTQKNVQPLTTAQRLSSIVKSCRDIMRKDKGLNGDLDRLPMLTWIMFLKFLDDMEQIAEQEAQMAGKRFRPALESPYRWRDWAVKPEGITGDELISFVNNEEAVRPDGTKGPGLFAYLRSLQGADGGDRRDVIATVFKGTINRMINGYLLRDVINKVSDIHFTSSDEIHTLGHLYESMLKEMRDAAGDSGEFYTPRPVVRFMVEVMNPKLGEVILDPACGTGGFLLESFKHLENQCKTVEDRQMLQTQSIFGRSQAASVPAGTDESGFARFGIAEDRSAEQPALPVAGNRRQRPRRYHHDQPAVRRRRRARYPRQLPRRQTDVRNRFALPPAPHAQTQTPKPGRAAVVVPNGTLFGDGICARIKEELLKDFNLHTVVRLPNGVFAPYTSIRTNLLFFNRSHSTEEVWYYEQPLPEGRKNYTKTQPIQFEEFAGCLEWWNKREENERAWKVPAKDLLEYNSDGSLKAVSLDRKNPNAATDFEHLPPEQLADDILKKEQRILEIMASIKAELAATS